MEQMKTNDRSVSPPQNIIMQKSTKHTMKRFANHLISTLTPQLFRIAWLALVLTAPTALALIAPTALGLSGVEAQTPITWTDVVGATYDHETHTLVRTTSPNGWGTSGAASANRLSKNTDGYVEYTIDGEFSTKAFGLSNGNSNAHYNTIDYSFHFVSENIYILEGSTVLGSFGTYSAGDVFKIERSESNINYYHEGVLLMTSSTNANQTLLVDAAIKHENATLADMETNFPDIYFDITTVEETNTFYSISGGGLSGTVATGNKSEYTIPLPEDGAPTTITLNFIDDSSVDQGIDLVFDVDAYLNLKNLRAIVSTGTYGLNDGDWGVSDMTNLTTSSTSSGLVTIYTGTSYCDDQDWNYVHTTTYKSNTMPISESKLFADGLGRSIQSQVRDYANDNVLVNQTIFDEFGRPSWQSLPAPKYEETMCYKDYFVVDPNYSVYRWDDFDDKSATGNVDNPNGVGVFAKGSLGWYYDNSNYEETHIAESDFPFTTAEYWPDPLGRVKRTSAPGEHHKMGSNHENRLYQMNQAGELAWIYGYFDSHIEGHDATAPARKSISVNADGDLLITYVDDAGLAIASCRSGVSEIGCESQNVKKTIRTNPGDPGYVDIHIPDGKNNSLIVSLNAPQYWNWNATTLASLAITDFYKILDLNTYEYLDGNGYDYTIDPVSGAVSFGVGSGYDVGHQFLRIIVEYPSAYLALLTGSTNNPIYFIDQHVYYELDYSQWTANYYDDRGRLSKVIPPAGIDCDYVPTIDAIDVFVDATSTCINCNGNASSTYKTNIEITDLNYTVPSILPQQDHLIHFIVRPKGTSFNDSQEFCDFMASDGTGTTPTLADPLNLDISPITERLTPTYLSPFTNGPLYVRKAVEEAAGNNSTMATWLPGGLQGKEPVGSCPYPCDGCIDPSLISPGQYFESHISDNATGICKNLGLDVKSVERVNDPLWTDGYYYCVQCKEFEEEVDVICSQKPYSFLAEFRLKVEVYGDDGSGPLTQLAADNDWIYATLKYRSCDCDLAWDVTSFTNAFGSVLNTELDNYNDIVLKWTDTEVRHQGSGTFDPFQAGDVIDELLSTLKLEVNYTHHAYPESGSNDPLHTMASTFAYDELNQLATTTTPDAGTSGHTFDAKGQLRFSQNAAQATSNRYNYFVYDQAGRPLETGEYKPVGSGDIYFENQIKTPALAAGTTSVHSIVDVLNGLNPANCSQQAYYQYDVPETNPAYEATLSGYSSAFNLGQLTKSYNSEHTSWYGYDRYGRQAWMVQYIDDLDKFVTLNYTYDFNHLLTEVAYQQEVNGERFHHHFIYDENGRLKTVKTSTDGAASTANVQARYEYYDHGPLKRVELGDETQGLDYVYTIQGMLKAINNPKLDGTNDPGADGQTATLNGTVAPDIFGLALDYFTGDYTRTGVNISSASGTVGNTTEDNYTGLVKAQRWQTNTGAMSGIQHTGKQLMYTYAYDNQYQLTSATFGDVGYTGTIPEFDGGSPSADYRVENITYDRNGNIQSLKRNAFAASNLAMDNFTYNYASGTNKLTQLEDEPSYSGNWTADLDNQNANNYAYNAAGQLTGDTADNSYMTYDAGGLVTQVHSDVLKTTLKASFEYNEQGGRLKKSAHNGSIVDETYYIRDAAGKIVAIYEKPDGQSLALKEQPIYGASRLGTYRDRINVDETHYELTDHLGNVRAVIKRAKDALGEAQLVSFADYYPFGSKMEGRYSNPSNLSRNGYQGQEMDVETGKNAFELRQYDGRLGRWTTTDPYSQHHSPYLAMSNNPVSFIDPNGGYSNSFDQAADSQFNLWRVQKAHGVHLDEYIEATGGGDQDPEVAAALVQSKLDRAEVKDNLVRYLDKIGWDNDVHATTQNGEFGYYAPIPGGESTFEVNGRIYGWDKSATVKFITAASIGGFGFGTGAGAGQNMDFVDLLNNGTSATGTLVSGAQFLVGSMKNQKLWNHSHKIHKQLKSAGVKVQTRVIKKGIKRGLSTASRKIAIVGGVLALSDIAIDGELKASHLLNLAVVGVSAIPVYGWAIGGAYFAIDMGFLYFSGKTLGERLDESVGGPLVNDIYDW